MLAVDLRPGHESSPGSKLPPRYQRLTRRTGSIRNLISFYETAYGKKDRLQKPHSIDPEYQRQMSSPPLSHCKLISNYLPVSSISSSPGFSPSLSSSSASSTERLSYYTNSFCIYSDNCNEKKENNQENNDSCNLQSPDLLWSVSTASSSSGFSSGFSSPLQSEPPADVIFPEHSDIHDLTEDIKHPKSKIPTSKSLFTFKQTATKTKATTLNISECNTKKTNSFTDISQRALYNLRNIKKNPPSLTKLLEKSKSFSKSKSTNKLKSDDELPQEATESEINDKVHKTERHNDLTVFKSIRKVFHTVRLCKLEKFSSHVPPVLKTTPSELVSEVFLEPEPAILDKTFSNVNPLTDAKSVNVLVSPVLTSEEIKKFKFEDEKASEPSALKTYNKSFSMIEAPTQDFSDIKSETKIKKSAFATKSFNKKEPTVTVSKSITGGLATKPTWSATMSSSYSFTKLSRSQSQRFPSTSSANKRRYDPKNTQKIVLDWCQQNVSNYDNVRINNFSSSWSDGLAFCALIHSFMPDAFEYKKLSAANRKQNFELAFNTAHVNAGIMPLLEVSDMLSMGDRPDDRCVFTYVSTIYTRFKNPKPKLNKVVSAPFPQTENLD